MKKLALILIFFTALCNAQQDTQFTQYMYNTITINPAYAGSRDALSIFGSYRIQWVGLDGAPQTGSFSVNTPLKNSKLGLGVSLISDRIGHINENTMSVDLSYSLPMPDESKLSFGIKTTANIFSLDPNRLSIEDQNDPLFQNLNNRVAPNFGAGIYWHSEKAYAGFSIPNFIETRHLHNDDTTIYKDKIHYYFMGGYVFDLNNDLKLKPTLLTKMVQGAPLQVDVAGNFMLYDKFVLGMAYRWSASISAIAGFQVSDALYLGYSYDHETTYLRKSTSGSHEIFLRYEFFNSPKTTRSSGCRCF